MLNSHDLRDRKVIAAVREYRHLQRNRYKIKTLDQPYQRGWRRFYTLSQRALCREDRSTLEAILKVIGSVVLHHSRSFQRRRGRSKSLCEIEQPLRPIPLHEWQRKNYPEAWLRYFQYQLLLERNQHWQPYLVFAQPNLYRLKIGRNWIHEVREIDPDIESRLGELDRWFEIHQGWRHHGRLKGQCQSYRWCDGEKNKQRYLTKEHRREMHRAALDFPEVDPAASVRRRRTSPRPPIFNLPGVAQCRGNELRPRPVRVQVLPPGPWNANRPSVPGFPAKEVVPPSAGWGASPPRSAIFHFPTDLKLRQRSSRLLTGGAGRTSLRVHQFAQ